jgi:hypothetical protein
MSYPFEMNLAESNYILNPLRRQIEELTAKAKRLARSRPNVARNAAMDAATLTALYDRITAWQTSSYWPREEAERKAGKEGT